MKIRTDRIDLLINDYNTVVKVVDKNAKGDNDIDVAIIVNQLSGNYFSTTPLIWKLRRQIDDRIEPILIEKDNDKSGFLDEIRKHGIEIRE